MPLSAPRTRRWRDRKKRGERLVTVRLTGTELERLAAQGYEAPAGAGLAAAVEAFISDSLAAADGPITFVR